ncbi:PREDICTED: pre-mRNA 3' end processing protein WDR33 isoform X2 [Nicrophorus vespilloides]|uniref:Pre-mRNA 3' end processing protein WDR33 isoform X2 n=1 Tax=Nicrophorus vespilloides TaxID=110193 RepID=A0ABM1MER1_NICVS|nr:PREDICTED: pre-mRNA 3' end processing protein WDR33 isoform X2 [Nicrophorus vespilloides]
MDFAQPPPIVGGHAPPPANLSMPPPNMPPPNLSLPPPNIASMGNPMGPPGGYNNPKGEYNKNWPAGQRHHFRPYLNVARPLPGPLGNMTLEDFDGKRLRKSVMRKTVDYNSSIIKALENRVWQRDFRDRRALQPDVMYYPDLMPPPSYPDNPINCVTTRFVKTATNKMRCPIFCMAWTPEGRRLVTGASSGEFTLWNGLTFNFETILQAHDSPVRTMVWSHNDSWMVTGDHAGYVKYWQSNMNNVKMFQAHKEALRGISFSPTDSKFVTCSDDGTLRIWDFFRYQEEKVLRGHGADVKCVHWHPQKGLIISGSKDNQQPIKLWDPKSGQSLATLHAHKSTVMDLKWNDNGNWLITASRDHLLKLFDLRNLGQEVQTFRGHKKEASSVAWHPHHEGLFCSGGSDGSIMFWHVGADKEVGAIEQAHDSIVWTLAWHPLGHILCSGSNDHTSKFWTRNRPGDQMRDKYNLNTLPPGVAGAEDIDIDEPSVIPGMGPEDKVESLDPDDSDLPGSVSMEIPGLDLDPNSNEDKKAKKVPYSKPIPRNFQAQWNETDEESAINEVISQIVENTPGVVPLQKITPNAIIIYGKLIPVEAGSKLEQAINDGPEALQKFIDSGQIEELHDVMPHDDEHDYLNDAYVDEEAEDENMDVKRVPTPPIWDKPPGCDQSSSGSIDQDMRPSFIPPPDLDMRNRGEMDYRGAPPDFMYNEGGGFNSSRYDDEDDDYMDNRNFQRNGGNFNNQFGRNGGPPMNFPPNYNRGGGGGGGGGGGDGGNFNNRNFRPDMGPNRGPPSSSNSDFRPRGGNSNNRGPPMRNMRGPPNSRGGRAMPHRMRGGPNMGPRMNRGQPPNRRIF